VTEIELKAHVSDPAETERRIRAFAAFRSETVKKDSYWTVGGKMDTSPQPGSPQTRTVGSAAAQPDTVAENASARMVVTAAATVAGTMAVAVVAAGLAIAGAGKIVIIGLCLGTAFLSAVAAVVAAIRSTPSRQMPAPQKQRLQPEHDEQESPDRPLKIRIREESSGDPASPAAQTVVTYKRKEFAGSVEVNDEKEFAIDSRADFEALLGDLGFAPAITKVKRTKTFDWTAPDGTAVGLELSLVGPLGWFIEIEILADSPDDAEIARARDLVGTALSRCGIPESAIETRFYTDMLAEVSRAKA